MLCARRDPRFLSPPCASRLSQMDFESASWQMVTLCIDPKSTCTCVSTIHAGVRTLTQSDVWACKGGCQHTAIASPSAFARGHHARRPAFSCTQRRCIDVSLDFCACMHACIRTHYTHAHAHLMFHITHARTHEHTHTHTHTHHITSRKGTQCNAHIATQQKIIRPRPFGTRKAT